MRFTTRKPLRRKAGIGAQKRQRVQHEANQAKALEGSGERLGLFFLHRVDWWHCVTAETASGSLKAGLPDYMLMGDGWFAMLEIKARNIETKRPGSMTAEQYTFHAKLNKAGIEVWTALLPDDLDRINLWLREKTGRIVEVAT